MNQILQSEEWNPYYNVALEYELMKKQKHGTAMFLWQNAASVFVGRNQNLYMECNVPYLKEQRILAVRRFSGGGAVYQDEGNLNFSFVCPSAEADTDKMKRVVEKAVNTIGVSCSFSGRNDLLAEGRKFSGHAYYEEDACFLYHGTLLCNVNLEQMRSVLSPSLLKLHSKGVSSVKSRVVNLCELVPTLTIEQMKYALRDAFLQEYGQSSESNSICKISADSFPVDGKLLQQLESEEWVYGEAPEWSVKLERKMPIGLVSAQVQILNGKIEDIQIYTDSLMPIDFSECRKNLMGKMFSEMEVFDEVENSVLSLSD